MYGYGGWGFRPYQSVASRKADAEKIVAKMVKSGKKVDPVRIEGKKIASTFWGKAWCDHLESFSDYENRLPRGRSYVRNGSVIDLKIEKGKIEALVQGSSLYNVTVTVGTLPEKKWKSISSRCSGEIGSVIELLQGRLSSSVMTTITDKHHGLFPLPDEIKKNCSCPDWADMCKHVAAVLYGVGARLDRSPQLLFTLRSVDHTKLIDGAKVAAAPRIGKPDALKGQDLSALFGIEVEEKAPVAKGLPKQKGAPRVIPKHTVKAPKSLQKSFTENSAKPELKKRKKTILIKPSGKKTVGYPPLRKPKKRKKK